MNRSKTNKNIFQFEQSPLKKGLCPKCNHKDSFRYFSGLPREYGKCERINNCGYINHPNNALKEVKQQLINELKNIMPTKPIEPKIIYPDPEFIKGILENQTSNFHRFCTNQIGITMNHLKTWGVGTEKEKTCFVIQNEKDTLNIKYFNYSLECKRDQTKPPYSLKSLKNEKYLTCLYGLHLFVKNKITCLVESEKTAVISAFFYPQFNWLATGGANGLTADKVKVLLNEKVYYLGDNDLAGKSNSSIKKLIESGVKFDKITLETAKNGEDLADLIIRGERPKIEVKEVEKTQIDPKKQSDKPKNNFTILRDYMLETWDFRYNIVRNEIEYKFKIDTDYKLLNDADVYIHLRENNIQFKKEDFTAILRSSIMQVYNPINRYFESLNKWDEKIDYIDKLSSYLEYKGNLNLQVHFKKWLVRAVKCAIEDKYFNKQIFVLVGKQNDGKSTFVRFLVPKELEAYYTENPDFKNKDGEIALTQNFIINMDELANIGKEDTDKLKTFISKVATNVRRPYEKNTRPEPRKASFMGTTNNNEFLTDHTGNVRWLNFKIEGINFNYSREININDVWSQAYSLYKRNFDCEISKEELKAIEDVNQGFKIQSLEFQVIKDYFIKPYEQNISKLKHWSATEILNYLEEKNPRYKTLNIQKIGTAMTSLGFNSSEIRPSRYQEKKKGYLLYLLENETS